MSDSRAQDHGLRDLFLFARSYLRGGRAKLLGVLALEAVLTGITGIGLLLILPLLGLLGFGDGAADNPIWQQLGAFLDGLGLTLNLETGLMLFIGVVGFRALLNWRRLTWQVEVEQAFQASLRHDLYETLARTELYCLQRLRTSEFIQSTQGEIRRAQQAANVLFQLFSQALNLVAYFVVALILSFQMTLFALLCGAIAFVAMLPLVRRTHRLSREQIRVRSSMINNLVEHIQGLRTARSLGLTGRFVADYQARSGQAAQVAVRLTRLSAFSGLLFELVAVLLLAAVVYVGLTGLDVEPARFVVLLLVFIRIFPAIGQFQNQLQLFASLLPSFRHYLDLLSELQQHEEVVPRAADAPRLRMNVALELQAVGFTYGATEDAALADVTLRIDKGSLTLLGGRSGAGKSTLVDIATGLLPPGSGAVCVDGHPLDGTERILWRRETALVPQESFLFNDSIRANLLCVKPDATARELWAVLEAANCRDFITARRDGLDTAVGERGGGLSGGERQRLSIARALLRDPQLLVLDEPTNNLDQASVAALLEILVQLKRRATLLVVSHDTRLVNIADRVYHLERGTLVADPVPSR
jgi:ATP-binding cassette subfamily C protein